MANIMNGNNNYLTSKVKNSYLPLTMGNSNGLLVY